MVLAQLILLAQLAHGGAARADCGLQESRAVVEKTEAMVLHDAPLDSLVGEFPTPDGTPERTRVAFSINSDGRPVDLRIPESSGNFEVDMAIVKTVKKYVMKTEFSGFRTYMLVFQVRDNKMPPNWFDEVKPVPASASSG